MDDLYLLHPVVGLESAGYLSGSREGPAKLEDTRLTLVHPFYNERDRFNRQVKVWAGWSDYVRSRVKIVLVDDGSPDPLHTYITPEVEKTLSGLNFSIHRIRKNLKWNTPGALNLGLTVATTDWVLIMDSDCSFDNDNMERLLKADPEEGAIYKFPRQQVGIKSEDLSNQRYLTCAMLFHRSIFLDAIGGFDEDFTGEYSGGYAYFDVDLDDRVRRSRAIPIFIWNHVTITYWMPSICGLVARSGADERVNRKLFYAKREARREELQVRNPTATLRFRHWRSYHHERT
jgi:glycosyltransferase involved in cell wall biosynthesis